MDLSKLSKRQLEAYSQITKVPASQIEDFEEFFLDELGDAGDTGDGPAAKRGSLPKFKVYAQIADDEWYCVNTSDGCLRNFVAKTMGDAVTFLEYGDSL